MVKVLIDWIFWFAFAAFFACLEIEIEGKYGFGQKLATWFRVTGRTAETWGKLQGGDPLTGYRLFNVIVGLFVFHVPFFAGMEWSLSAEFKMLAIMYAVIIAEDYIWFVLNPYYGAENFRKDNIWWHAKKKWIDNKFPKDYADIWITSIAFSLLAGYFGNNWDIFWNHIGMLASFLIFTIIVAVVIAPRYKKWYVEMRKHDERDKARIFHTLPIPAYLQEFSKN